MHSASLNNFPYKSSLHDRACIYMDFRGAVGSTRVANNFPLGHRPNYQRKNAAHIRQKRIHFTGEIRRFLIWSVAKGRSFGQPALEFNLIRRITIVNERTFL